MLDWGREVAGDLDVAERREWLSANGIGGFASGTVAGSLTRRYHGLLVAEVEETPGHHGLAPAVGTNPWAGGAGAPRGDHGRGGGGLGGPRPGWGHAVGRGPPR